MTTMHTPGPWWVDASDKRYGDHRVSSEQGMVAVVGNGHNIGSARHDARLIASAPALLEALEALFANYKELADCGDCGNWSLEDQPVGKQALAVIASARGTA